MSSPVLNTRVTCIVSNDLIHDQRMQRICLSLQEEGYEVTLVGRKRNIGSTLQAKPYLQIRLNLIFEYGFLFYAILNIRLFIYLLFNRSEIIYAVDMDTLPAGLLAAQITGSKCIYDAHEYYSESPELVKRKGVKKFWQLLERILIPVTDARITVSQVLAQRMREKFHVEFVTLQNLPVYYTLPEIQKEDKFILYQGALNLGRGLEELIIAMKDIPLPLVIAGEGDMSEQLKQLTISLGLSEKVKFLGWVSPLELQVLSTKAWLGVNLLEDMGESYRLSLANKFFDYVMAGVPVLCTPFQAYLSANEQHSVAQWVYNLSPEEIQNKVFELMDDSDKYNNLKNNCIAARETWNWQEEKKVLFEILKNIDR